MTPPDPVAGVLEFVGEHAPRFAARLRVHVAHDDRRAVAERLLAVTALSVTQAPKLVVHEGDNMFLIETPAALRTAAEELLTKLEGGKEGPLRAAAAAALEGN